MFIAVSHHRRPGPDHIIAGLALIIIAGLALIIAVSHHRRPGPDHKKVRFTTAVVLLSVAHGNHRGISREIQLYCGSSTTRVG